MPQPDIDGEQAKQAESSNNLVVNRTTVPGEGGSSLQKRSDGDMQDTYEAPLSDGSSQSCPRLPDEYMVLLRSDYTVAQHLQHVGCDVKPTAELKFDTSDLYWYAAHLTAEQLAAVRSDPGVKLVEVDTYGEDEDEDGSD